MISQNKLRFLLVVVVILISIMACQSVEEPNTSPLTPTLDNDSLVETAIQMLLVTETYEADQAGQTLYHAGIFSSHTN